MCSRERGIRDNVRGWEMASTGNHLVLQIQLIPQTSTPCQVLLEKPALW